MPIYDYICANCSTRTEFIHGIEAPAPRFCPACGAEDTLRKAFVAPTVVFKGSGWAKKDRASSGSATSQAGGGAGESKDTAGAGSSRPPESSGGANGSSSGSDPKAGSGSTSGSSKSPPSKTDA